MSETDTGSTISPSQLQEDLHHALKTWHEAGPEASPLDYLQIFQQARLAGAGNTRQATNHVLFQAIEALAVEHTAEANLLRKRFLDGLTTHAVANQLNVSEATAYRKQQEALKLLARLVLAQETQARANYQANLEKRLHLPPDVTLFGVEKPLQTLLDGLSAPEPPWLFAVEGLGGIGKTALANALVRRPELLGRFANVAWVSAKQQEFLPGSGIEQTGQPALTAEALIAALLEQLDPAAPLVLSPQEKKFALTQLLKKAPHLIVIDNLETVVDYQALLPDLRHLANPGKFILTSRYSLQAQPDVFCYSLAELSQAEVQRFIRYEAKMRGQIPLLNAAEADLDRIYEAAGGNPLALKLIIGQLSVLPLSQVLDNLKQARGQSVDELYTYIYWQAWQLLDPAGRHTLLLMPLAQGGPLAQLLALTQLDPADLNRALQQLAGFSLVQVSGDLEERRYTIHRLTETFLLREVAKWQASP